MEVQGLLHDLTDDEHGERFRFLSKRIDSMKKAENAPWVESLCAENQYIESITEEDSQGGETHPKILLRGEKVQELEGQLRRLFKDLL